MGALKILHIISEDAELQLYIGQSNMIYLEVGESGEPLTNKTISLSKEDAIELSNELLELSKHL